MLKVGKLSLACRVGHPPKALIECSWHSLGSVIIPTGVCLALEKGTDSPLGNTKTKGISPAKSRGREPGETAGLLSHFLLSARLAVCWPGSCLSQAPGLMLRTGC